MHPFGQISNVKAVDIDPTPVYNDATGSAMRAAMVWYGMPPPALARHAHLKHRSRAIMAASLRRNNPLGTATPVASVPISMPNGPFGMLMPHGVNRVQSIRHDSMAPSAKHAPQRRRCGTTANAKYVRTQTDL